MVLILPTYYRKDSYPGNYYLEAFVFKCVLVVQSWYDICAWVLTPWPYPKRRDQWNYILSKINYHDWKAAFYFCWQILWSKSTLVKNFIYILQGCISIKFYYYCSSSINQLWRPKASIRKGIKKMYRWTEYVFWRFVRLLSECIWIRSLEPNKAYPPALFYVVNRGLVAAINF